MKDKKEKKPGRWKRVVLITLGVILALILIIGACIGVYVNYLLGKIGRVDMENESKLSSSEVEQMLSTDPDLIPVDPSESLPSLEEVTFPTEITEPSAPTEPGTETKPQTKPQPPVQTKPKPEHVTNILLVGQDRRGNTGRARSDSMILVTFNKKAGTITLTSFMRDAYVQIPGYKPNKLNHAFAYGGFSLLNKTLLVNFGVEVDGNVEVDFNSFKKLIDLMGGVDITLTEKEAEYLRNGSIGKYEVYAGLNRLSGEEALMYARLREIDSDYQRANRQRKVLLSLAQAYKDQPVDQMLALLEEIMGMVTTNMSNQQIWDTALDLTPMLANAEYKTMQIPAHGTFRGGNVLVRPGLKAWFQYDIDFAANRKLLQNVFEEE